MKNKKLIIWFVSIVALIIVIIVIGVVFFKKTSSENIYQKNLNFNNWYSNMDKLALSEEQKLIVDYYNNNYVLLDNYEFLKNYVDIYKDINITGYVNITQNTNNKIYANILTRDNGNYEYALHQVILKGNINYPEGTILLIYGKVLEIDSETNYPVIQIDRAYKENEDSTFTKFTNEDFQKMTTYLWDKDVSVRKAILDKDYSLDELHNGHDFMIATINKTNTVFRKMELLEDQNKIRSSKSTIEELKDIYIALDFKHFIVIEYNKETLNLNLKYYDKEYKELWSRGYTTGYYPIFDYTLNELYILIDEKLITINLNNGHVINSITVDKPLKVFNNGDSLVVVDHNYIKSYTKSGELLWYVTLDNKIKEVTSIQSIEDNIVVEYLYNSAQTSSLIKIDQDGNILGETVYKNDSKDDSKNDSKSEESFSNIKEIDVATLESMLNDQKDFILILTGTTCPHCLDYKPVINEVLKDNNIDAYNIDLWQLNSDDRSVINNYFSDIKSVPTTLFIKNGKELVDNRFIGNREKDVIITNLTEAGFIQ